MAVCSTVFDAGIGMFFIQSYCFWCWHGFDCWHGFYCCHHVQCSELTGSVGGLHPDSRTASASSVSLWCSLVLSFCNGCVVFNKTSDVRCAFALLKHWCTLTAKYVTRKSKDVHCRLHDVEYNEVQCTTYSIAWFYCIEINAYLSQCLHTQCAFDIVKDTSYP